MPDLDIAKDIADLAETVGNDDIDVDKAARRLHDKHPDSDMTTDEIGDALTEEIERNWQDEQADEPAAGIRSLPDTP